MKNIETKIENNVLTIKVDLSKSFGKSKTGKSTIIASSEGNVPITIDTYLGINVYKK